VFAAAGAGVAALAWDIRGELRVHADSADATMTANIVSFMASPAFRLQS
jgi:hypothetical protein